MACRHGADTEWLRGSPLYIKALVTTLHPRTRPLLFFGRFFAFFLPEVFLKEKRFCDA